VPAAIGLFISNSVKKKKRECIIYGESRGVDLFLKTHYQILFESFEVIQTSDRFVKAKFNGPH